MRHAAFLLACAGLLAACGPPPPRDAAAGGDALRGAVLTEPQPKIEFSLLDTGGQPFPFRERTDGYLTLLFFGYTYCPDICPVHMANLGRVIGELPPSVARRIKVIFVTTDPERDNPQRLREWLDHFSTEFIGLGGDRSLVNEIQRRLGLPPSQRGEADSTGAYLVGHSASVVAFTPDNMERAFYPFGIRQADWAHDIPLLLEYE